MVCISYYYDTGIITTLGTCGYQNQSISQIVPPNLHSELGLLGKFFSYVLLLCISITWLCPNCNTTTPTTMGKNIRTRGNNGIAEGRKKERSTRKSKSKTKAKGSGCGWYAMKTGIEMKLKTLLLLVWLRTRIGTLTKTLVHQGTIMEYEISLRSYLNFCSTRSGGGEITVNYCNHLRC